MEPPKHETLPPPGEKERAKGRRRWILWMAAGLAALILIVFFFGYLPRRRRREQIVAQAEREQRALPVANVAPVRRSPSEITLLLPGNVTPLTESYLYARASGYIRRRYADIGDRVRSGQVLADIESPELDAQVAQARAAVAQTEKLLAEATASQENAKAQEELARVTWQRYSVLVSHGAVSRQEADTQLANYRAAQANVKLQSAAIESNQENVRASRANLERLVAMQSFEHVRAPFDGIITARNFDVGALISGGGNALGVSTAPLGGTQLSGAAGNQGAGGITPAAPETSGGGAGGELYRVAQIDVLRVLVNVPQENAATVRIGQPASVLAPEYSKRKFAGKVTRTSKSLDPTARTMIAEVQVANREQLLLPGMYAQVEFANYRSNPPLLIPGDSIMQTPNGLQVAILAYPTQAQREWLERQPEYRAAAGQIRRIQLRNVEVGRDYGPQIEVTEGLEGWEYVVTSPGDHIAEDALVAPRPAPDVGGQGNPQQRGPNEQKPAGIGSASRAAPSGGSGGGKGGGR